MRPTPQSTDAPPDRTVPGAGSRERWALRTMMTILAEVANRHLWKSRPSWKCLRRELARPSSTHRRGLPRDRKLHPPSRRGTFCEERAPPAQMESGGPPGKQSWRRPSGAAARLAAPSTSQRTCAPPPRVASWKAGATILVARDERKPRATAQPRS